jgi:hypothetical protein
MKPQTLSGYAFSFPFFDWLLMPIFRIKLINSGIDHKPKLCLTAALAIRDTKL